MIFFNKKTSDMPWDHDAESAVNRAPFFVRTRIRAKVEAYCRSEGKKRVSLDDVNKAKNDFTRNMHKNIKGYQIASCFSSSGCPNRISDSEKLIEGIETELEKADVPGFLKKHLGKDLKFHHELRISIADCPNSCSQPQIADFGLVAASLPLVKGINCTMCGECVIACPDKAIILDQEKSHPVIDSLVCQKCGICVKVCGFDEIIEERKGYRILLGGRLGRHPRIGLELPGIFSAEETVLIFKWCLDFYFKNSFSGKRFSQIFKQSDFDEISRKIDLGFFSS